MDNKLIEKFAITGLEIFIAKITEGDTMTAEDFTAATACLLTLSTIKHVSTREVAERLKHHVER